MNLLFLFPTLLTSTISVCCDIHSRTIPNTYSYGLFVFNSVLVFLEPSITGISVLFLLPILMIIWNKQLLGGGDIKLLLASSLVVPLEQMMIWILAISSIGAIQALYVIVRKQTNQTVPYAIAIAGGNYVLLLL